MERKKKYDKRHYRKYCTITDYYTNKQFLGIQKALKLFYDENYEELNKNINWTETELAKIDEIKQRREKEWHYDRFDLFRRTKETKQN